jgi:hypothetical protein
MLKKSVFSSTTGANPLFKPLTHPLVFEKIQKLMRSLQSVSSLAIYDPLNFLDDLNAFLNLEELPISNIYAQNYDDLGTVSCGKKKQPILDLVNCEAEVLFVCSFEKEVGLAQIQTILPKKIEVIFLDQIKLPEDFLSNSRNYLDTINFATNFALLKEAQGQHTRLISANYWYGYRESTISAWLCLFDQDGNILAQWEEEFGSHIQTIVFDSKVIRKRFNLPEFIGSLFIHMRNVSKHDIFKYCLDVYGDKSEVLSCTHDANSWPSLYYAGMPAPKVDEKVILWIQNSTPFAIPANTVKLSRMGRQNEVSLEKEIPPFATYPLDVSMLLPDVKWPEQFDVYSGNYFVRPRYEVIAENGRSRIAHLNVERSDVQLDSEIPKVSEVLGKGFLLPAPILPGNQWKSFVLPTPMSKVLESMPLGLYVYSSEGKKVLYHTLGNLPRDHKCVVNIQELMADYGKEFKDEEYGHLELVYDFSHGGMADAWLHAIFRYEDFQQGHTAETSFGAHIFNTAFVYKNEPQSYVGRPPGLSTRLFLRLGGKLKDTLCHLVFPCSSSIKWHPQSSTHLLLYNQAGQIVAERTLHIPCGGSLLWRYRELFDVSEQEQAGDNAYILIRDLTCRLFGYHGLVTNAAFSLDHMFGF